MPTALNKLSLHLGSEISLKDFSFSQLIIAVEKIFDISRYIKSKNHPSEKIKFKPIAGS